MTIRDKQKIDKKIAFIGSGNMGEALIKGITAASIFDNKDIIVTDIMKERLEHIKKIYKVNVTTDNRHAVSKSDIIVLALKPQIIAKVISDVTDLIGKSKLIITIAAGITVNSIHTILGKRVRVIRVMPNTPAIIQEGVSAIACGDGILKEDLKITQRIFRAVGKTVVVEESMMDAVTGLSGSGPAYVFLIIESLTDAGVKMGLPRDISRVLSIQTIVGSARLALETGEHPGKLKDMVTSPGGTTIAGLHALEEGGLRAALINAVESATRKSEELGRRRD
ncbi:MAG: pyrroline-5-carboxylate reductase [Nitrospinae bacterium]|nr:pyrroline-5-carboxylate reductase [Nitrospinota bacterium]